MSPNTIALTAATVVILVIVVAMVNTLIGRKNQVAYAFASIDAMLKKRYDLIPNLVSVVERYMGYEKDVLSSITAARVRAISGSASEDERVELDNDISRALKSIFAVAENYPDLKASASFVHLQASLNEVEEQIAASRRAFNAAVTRYNNAVEMFPINLVAQAMGYRVKPWFETVEEERQPVRVWR
jgi:LemA protein